MIALATLRRVRTLKEKLSLLLKSWRNKADPAARSRFTSMSSNEYKESGIQSVFSYSSNSKKKLLVQLDVGSSRTRQSRIAASPHKSLVTPILSTPRIVYGSLPPCETFPQQSASERDWKVNLPISPEGRNYVSADLIFNGATPASFHAPAHAHESLGALLSPRHGLIGPSFKPRSVSEGLLLGLDLQEPASLFSRSNLLGMSRPKTKKENIPVTWA